MTILMRPDASASIDEILEYAARLIEEINLADMSGVWAKRKRTREDAALRVKTVEETRKDCASCIRAMKNRRDLDAIEELRHLANLGDHEHDMYLLEAWPLAWKGWLNIKATIRCNSNCIPPETTYRIEITDEGRKVLSIAGTQP